MSDSFVIKKPLTTEKATRLQSLRKYVFMVAPSATKNEVKKAVKEMYRVQPVAVHIVHRPPKTKRFRGIVSRRGGYAKAVVTLKEGEKIDLG